MTERQFIEFAIWLGNDYVQLPHVDALEAVDDLKMQFGDSSHSSLHCPSSSFRSMTLDEKLETFLARGADFVNESSDQAAENGIRYSRLLYQLLDTDEFTSGGGEERHKQEKPYKLCETQRLKCSRIVKAHKNSKKRFSAKQCRSLATSATKYLKFLRIR